MKYVQLQFRAMPRFFASATHESVVIIMFRKDRTGLITMHKETQLYCAAYFTAALNCTLSLRKVSVGKQSMTWGYG